MSHLPFKILQADHTGITVRDIEASLAFWHDVLGFKLLYRARRMGAFAEEVTGVAEAEIDIAVLLAPGHKIELLQYIAPCHREHLRPRACDIGSVHVAFDVDNLDAVLAHIKASGWTAVGDPQIVAGGARNGTRVVYVRDPDGTTIELMQPPTV
jgi:catechol 2,3-dioxygenase-like lactoylglutathione lyase family enzyme